MEKEYLYTDNTKSDNTIYNCSFKESCIAGAAISSSISPIVFLDKDETVTYANLAFLSIWGYDHIDEVVSRNISEFVSLDEKRERINRKLQEKGGWIGELKAFRNGGGEFPVQVSTTILTDRNIPYCLMISFIDISDRVNAQNEQQRLLKDLRERVKELNCIYNILSIQHQTNNTLEDILHHIVNAIPSSLRWPEAAYARIVVGGVDVFTSNFKGSARLLQIPLTLDNENGFLEVGYYPVFPDVEMQLLDEEIELLGAASKEIEHLIEHKRTEDKLNINREKLLHADKLSSIGVLSAEIMHEIGNPNNFIALNAGIITKAWQNVLPILDAYFQENGNFSIAGLPYTQAKTEIGRLIDGISEGSKRIKNISSRLQWFAAKSRPSTKELFGINDAVLKAVEFTRDCIELNTDNFSCNLDNANPMVKGDSNQIQQVIINLITNACQALTSKKESVTIHTCTDENKFVKVTIKDEGKGIDPYDLPHVMEPFYSTKNGKNNTGLGLSISNDIAISHGGTLQLRSTPGLGTEVELLLPIAKGKSK